MENYLKMRRVQLGLTQKEAADMVGVSEATISRWEGGQIANMKRQYIAAYAAALRTTPEFIMTGVESDAALPANAIPYRSTGMAPVLGRIPAGNPAFAEGYIEGYEPVDVSDPKSYYWLRVQGDSMVNAGIQSGDLVLIHMQPCAENGQIVACRVNGDEATLKRYREQQDAIILLPENPAYDPRIVSKRDFADGYAAIMGVAVEVKRKL